VDEGGVNTVFQLSSLLVVPFWALMVFAPRWRWTRRIIGSPWIIVGAALLYATLVIPQLLELAPILANPSLDRIAPLLGTPAGATISWVHFLAFDLFTARWAYLESRSLNMNAALTSVTLVVILMFGPLGWLTFMAARAFSWRGEPEAARAA
jgi:Domain of unknown function (DUF4281)